MEETKEGTNEVPNTNKETPEVPVKTDEEIKAGLVEEIKKLRSEKNTYKELLDSVEAEKNKAPETNDIAKQVEEILNQKELSRAQANKKAAFEKFINGNKEFAEGNDPAGIKRQALENKFKRFNTDGLLEVEDFESVIKDAHSLLVGNDKPPVISKENPYSSGGPNLTANPSTIDDDPEISPREKKLMEKFNYPKEKLMKLKEKNPTFLDELLEHVRD